MDKLLQSLPPGLFASIVVLLFVILLWQLNPPHTACDSQIVLLKEKLDPLFFTKPDSKRGGITPKSLYSKHRERCMQGASLGSCLAFFEALYELDKQLLASPGQCVPTILKLPEVSKTLTESLSILVRLAWGPKAPESSYYKNSWYTSYHLRAFCQLRDWYENANGAPAWRKLREEFMKQLPGAEALSRDEVWARSILSTPCDKL